MKTYNKKIIKSLTPLLVLSLASPLILSACGGNNNSSSTSFDPRIEHSITFNTIDEQTITKKVKEGDSLFFEQMNEKDVLNIGFKNTSNDNWHNIGDSLVVTSDLTFDCQYVDFYQSDYASFANSTFASTDLVFRAYVDYTSFSKYSNLKYIGGIALASDLLNENLDFTFENYPNAIINKITPSSFDDEVKVSVTGIGKDKFNLRYASRFFVETNDGKKIYLDYTPYYSTQSVTNMAKYQLTYRPTDSYLNSYAQGCLDVNYNKGNPTLNLVSNGDVTKKIITSSTTSVTNKKVTLSINVDKENFALLLENSFYGILFEDHIVNIDSQNFDSSSGKVTVTFTMPNHITLKSVDNFYKGDYLEDESILLIAETNEFQEVVSKPKAKLLFHPKEIMSIKWYYHNDRAGLVNPTITLIEGRDFTVEGDYIVAKGNISHGEFVPSTTNIPWIKDKQLTGEINTFPGLGSPNQIKNKNNPNWFIPFTENNEVIQLQLSVSYTHSGKWEGDRQEYYGNGTMQKVVNKFKNKEDVNLLIIGASNSTGANTSGYLHINPYMDTWMDQVVNNLSLYYGNKINYENRASGGTSAIDSINGGRGWINHGQEICQPSLRYMLGLDQNFDFNKLQRDYPSARLVGDRFANVPDLVFIEYGINDPSRYRDVETYKGYMKRIFDSLYEKNPNVCILVFTGMWVNPISANNDIEENFHAAARDLCKTYPSADSINLSHMIQSLVSTGKNYTSFASNNVNHFNDFVTRVVTMMFLDALIENR